MDYVNITNRNTETMSNKIITVYSSTIKSPLLADPIIKGRWDELHM